MLTDPHMGHHASGGNCEYDLLLVARPVEETQPDCETVPDADEWLAVLRRDRPVSLADEANMRSGASIATSRWGRLPA